MNSVTSAFIVFRTQNFIETRKFPNEILDQLEIFANVDKLANPAVENLTIFNKTKIVEWFKIKKLLRKSTFLS